MRNLLAGVACLALVAGCTPAQVSTSVSTACTDIARLPPQAVAVLNAQDPHSALGVLWIDAQAACVAGAPTPGVNATWGAMVWGEVKALIPQVLPMLVPLLVGLL